MNSKNKYYFPVNLKLCSEYGNNSPAHTRKSKHAIDFIVLEGTPIYAALLGKVIYTKSNSKVSGNNKKFENEGNGVIIKHANNEFSLYWRISSI